MTKEEFLEKYHSIEEFSNLPNIQEEFIKLVKENWVSYSTQNITYLKEKYSLDEIIEFIDKNLECEYCGKFIFDLSDFPEYEDGELLCEDCYHDKYYEVCPLCDEYHETKNIDLDDFPNSPFFYYNPNDATKSGVYEVNSLPVFTSDYFSADIQWTNVRMICNADVFIKHYPQFKTYFSGDNERAEFVCNECWTKAIKLREQFNINKKEIK